MKNKQQDECQYIETGVLISEMPISDDSSESQREEMTTGKLSKMQDEEAEENYEKRRQTMAAKLGIKVNKGSASIRSASKLNERSRASFKPGPILTVASLSEDHKEITKMPDEATISKEIKAIDDLLKQKALTMNRGKSLNKGSVRKITPKFIIEGKFKVLPSNANAITKANVRTIPLDALKESTLRRVANIKNNGNSTTRLNSGNIHERSEAWLNEKSRKIENKKKEKEEKAIERCTFEPSLKKPLLKNIKIVKGNFQERNNEWIEKRIATIRKKQADAQNQELLPCTFAPRIHSSSHMTINDPGSFYLRNIQWKETIVEKTARKVPFTKRVMVINKSRYQRIEEH